MPRRSNRRNYNRISADRGDDATNNNVAESDNALDEPLSPSSEDEDDGIGAPAIGGGDHRDETLPIVAHASGSSSTTATTTNTPPIHREINVIVMDAAQSKFRVRCDARWKVSEFKEASATVTKVPPRSQRLIHMGKLLADDSTLGDFGINESEKIIHLFPKPNVVINDHPSDDNNSGEVNARAADDDDGEGGGGGGGAHVPQIVLDAEEADRRSQILILSSQEIFEAQHRVKIFSFLLMIVSSMELLTLVTLFVGEQAEDPTGYGGGGSEEVPPGNPTDAVPSGGGAGGASGGMQMRTWQDSDYFDAIVSAFGFYVSLLGIRSATENTLRLARRYCACLVVAGVGYNSYYYYTNLQQEEKRAEERSQSIGESELYTTAFIGILLPLTVWLLCIVRAYQFQSLIREAEVEAEERTRGLNDGEGSSNNNGGGEGEATRASLPYGSDDLELAVEQGVPS